MFEIRTRGRLALAALMLPALVATAHAHVTLEAHEAPAHSYFKAEFLAGHGCDGAATTSIEVSIPEGVVGVKPMPKPGWTLTTADGPYAHPLQVHGKTVTSGVATVTWSGGPLPDAWSDEFAFVAQLPICRRARCSISRSCSDAAAPANAGRKFPASPVPSRR